MLSPDIPLQSHKNLCQGRPARFQAVGEAGPVPAVLEAEPVESVVMVELELEPALVLEPGAVQVPGLVLAQKV